MKQLSILVCATSIVLLQTGCFYRNYSATLHDAPAASTEAFVPEAAVTKSIKSFSTIPEPSPTSNTAESDGAAAQEILSALEVVPRAVDISQMSAGQVKASQADLATAPVGELQVAQAVPNYVNISSFWVSTADGLPLEMRSQGNLQSPVIATLAHNSSVIIRIGDPTGTWFEVATPEGKVGWVLGAYLVNFHTGARVSNHLPDYSVVSASDRESSDLVRESVAQQSQETLSFEQVVQTLDGGPLAMRVNPHLNSDLVKALPNGTPVENLYNLGPWSHVRTQDGLEGFVATDYLVLRGK